MGKYLLPILKYTANIKVFKMIFLKQNKYVNINNSMQVTVIFF